MRIRSLIVAALFPATALAAQQPAPTAAAAPAAAKPAAAMSEKHTKLLLSSALSALPKDHRAQATVMAPGADGQMITLQPGTNGWTCFPDNPKTPGKDPMCVDAIGLQWVSSWMKHDPKPATTQPGFASMLAGGSDISASDPWAMSTKKFVSSPPHYMILWAFDAAKTGLSTKPSKKGAWIMWAGTPYAHLMVNRVP